MIYAFGQYELDTRVYELRRSGEVRAVEPQVFDVLAYLVSNRDRVVSKDELLEKLWPDRFVSETTLTSRLKEARKAVGDTGQSQSVIRTARGRGYRFVAPVQELGDPATSGLVACVSGNYLVPISREPETVLNALADQIARTEAPEGVGFVGRRRELERLAEALRLALGGTRQIVFVTGEAGAGKTTLVDTFLDQAPPASPVLVARGQCVEYRGSGEPYMPLLDAMTRLSRGAGGGKVVPILRSEAPSWLVQMPSIATDEEMAILRSRTGSAGERMPRELGMMIDRLTTDTPLILVLEDLHWSDYATLDAIDILARQDQPSRLLIIGTWRPSDVKAARHPIYALTQELRVRGRCEVIPLPLLGSDELERYLELRFGTSSFIRGLAPILHARTAGNALFVGNLVDSWIDRNLIRRSEDGIWSLGAELRELERDVPDTLQHLIENQISQLHPEQQQILEVASVIGRSFQVALIASTLPAADDDVERECERLVRESSIVRGTGTEHWGDGSLTSSFSFVHDLYVDVLYERIPAVRRSRLHLQVGQALERAWGGREKRHAPELALHFQRALDRVRGPKYLQLAAEQAIERSAYREAVDHLTGALDLLEDAPPTSERSSLELQLRCRLAPALVATRGWADAGAEQNYLRARELAEDLEERQMLSQTLYGLANMYEFRGEYQLAERVTRDRIALDTSGTAARALESHELLTCSLLHQGRYQESVRHGEQALSAYESSAVDQLEPDLLVLLIQAHGWISAALHFSGRADDGIAHSLEALAMAEESGNELARASANIQAGFLRFYRREPLACDELAGIGGEIARELRFPFHVACARILQGWARATMSGSSESSREIRAGIRTAEAIGARMDMPLFYAILAEVLAGSGELDDATDAIDSGLERLNRGRTFFYLPELYRQRGAILIRNRKTRSEGIAALQRAFALSREQECTLFALRAARDLAAIGESPWIETLRSIHGRFDQGLDTIDMKEVAALIAD